MNRLCLLLGTICLAIVVSVQSAEPLDIQQFSLLNNSQVRFQFPTEAGKGYIVQGSGDVRSWFDLTTQLGDGSVIIFSESVGAGARFYRVAQVPPTDLTNRPPANDQFASAIVLTGATATATGNNERATREDGEPSHSYFDSGNQSVWWSWTAPKDGPVTVSTVGTYFDTLVAVYTGTSVKTLTPVAKNRFLSRQAHFDGVTGTTYFIAVDGNFDFTGDIVLTILQTDPSTGIAPASVADVAVVLNETSNPNVPLRQIIFSSDASSWVERDVAQTNIVDTGLVQEFSTNGITATLKLDAFRGADFDLIEYVFTFQTSTSGKYAYSIFGVPQGEGTFANFRSTKNGFAPSSIAGNNIILTRVSTSTGPSGQTHFFAFTADNRFQDSDGEEHGAGTYTYSTNGSEATLILNYTGPEFLEGDKQEIQLKFTSATEGTSSAAYTRNDGAIITIEGIFSAELLK